MGEQGLLVSVQPVEMLGQQRKSSLMVSRIDAQGHHLGHERHMVGHGAKLHRRLKFESAIKGPHVLGAVTEEQMPGRTKLSRDPSAALPSIGPRLIKRFDGHRCRGSAHGEHLVLESAAHGAHRRRGRYR